MKNSRKLISGIFLFFTLAFVLSGCTGKPLYRYEQTRDMMDTYIRIVVYAEDVKSGNEALSAAFSRMEEIELTATSWDAAGEAYKLNETGYLENASPELIEMLELSIEYNKITNGCFDITVQPLLDLWQYNPNAEQQFWDLSEAEQLEKINEAKKLVGSDKIIIKGKSVRLQEGSSITLGGIAKGYAGDKALDTLKDMGVNHALIDAGGDIKTMGTMPDGTLWNIALVNPDDTTDLLADFYVEGMAVTTSGNYERYFDPDKEISHILNPVTGYSAGDCISVTIIAENGAVADILATGVFVMGSKNGLELVESLDNVETMIIDSDRNIHKSSGLSAYMK
ncbi:MAG: FAD:protein FMN transferase [Dehalococcoidales bacterium]|nr:FAD:protein FMN transferase [Dehalococcoidales bacterium]